MTVDSTSGGGGAIQPYDEDFGNLGLEDVSASDLVMPRITIDHDEGVFVNSLTKEQFPALTVILLGLVKQRVFWPDDLEDGDKPLCKSPDNTHGFPRVGDNIPKSKQFPWARSNFTPDQMQTVDIEPGENAAYPTGWSSNQYGTLPCDACVFAKWGKDEDGTSSTNWIPALLTVQRSAIKNSRQYVNGFAQSRQAMFTVYTGLTLTQESRGKVRYSVPNFKRMGSSDRSQWGEYANQLRSVRDFIRSAPRRSDDSDVAPAPSSNENTPPPAAEPAQPPAPPQPQSPPTAAPAAAPPAPPTPPAPPAPPAPPSPTSQPSGSSADDDDLPF